MFHRIYHMYNNIKIMEKIGGGGNKPTFRKPQYMQTTKSKPDNMMKVPHDLHYFQLHTYQVVDFNKVVFENNGK